MSKITYPKSRTENYKFRAQILSGCKHDPQFRAAIRKIVGEDILFWFNTFGWIYEPRRKKYKALGYTSPHLLFLTWDFQDKIILWLKDSIEKERDGLVEKSRDMGMSWMVLSVFLWFWMFKGAGNDFLIGSRKEEYVDKSGAMDALFPKIRYALKRQPDFLMPEGFNWRKHSTFMRLKNPETESYIKGEANNKYFGSGGRYRATLLDEFAKWEYTDEDAWQSLSDATPTKIAISSAVGTTNQFYRLRSQAAGKIAVQRLHWKLHPLKDRAWYNNEKKRRSDADLAAEVDIDYTASVEGKAYRFKSSIHVKRVPHLSGFPIELSCDFNVKPMQWVLAHDIKGRSRYFDEISEQTKTTTEEVMLVFCKKYVAHKNKTLYVYGDASGQWSSTKSKQSDYDIIKRIAKMFKWQVILQVPRANPPIKERLNATNKRLQDWENKNMSHVDIDWRCKKVIDSLQQTVRKDDGIDKSLGVEHASDAFSYRECYKYPVRKTVIGTRDVF